MSTPDTDRRREALQRSEGLPRRVPEDGHLGLLLRSMLRDVVHSEVSQAIEATLVKIESLLLHSGARNRQLLTASQVAEYLQVDPKTVYEWIRVGKLRAVRAGGVVRMEHAALNDFLEGVSYSRGDASSVDEEAEKILRGLGPFKG